MLAAAVVVVVIVALQVVGSVAIAVVLEFAADDLASGLAALVAWFVWGLHSALQVFWPSFWADIYSLDAGVGAINGAFRPPQ